MALCLMYLTDNEADVAQATNASLTKLLRLQTQLATGQFLMNNTNQMHCSFFQGDLQNLSGKQNGVDQESSLEGDAIQVSKLI